VSIGILTFSAISTLGVDLAIDENATVSFHPPVPSVRIGIETFPAISTLGVDVAIEANATRIVTIIILSLRILSNDTFNVYENGFFSKIRFFLKMRDGV
jgi:hypothetical protein